MDSGQKFKISSTAIYAGYAMVMYLSLWLCQNSGAENSNIIQTTMKENPTLGKTLSLLKSGARPVRIVCFGDSITGVYYFTGGRRAWSDMLGIGLQRVYPRASTEMINAGKSGNTTVAALQRLEAEVINRKPDLVVISFGMNDVKLNAKISPDVTCSNLTYMVNRCRAIGAEVVLCTPNIIFPTDPNRPLERLAQYAEIIHMLGDELEVPVVDNYVNFEKLKTDNHRAWLLSYGHDVHPNLRGHKLIAQEIIKVMTGESISLDDVPPPVPSLPHLRAKLGKGELIAIIAMPPYDEIIKKILPAVNTNAKIEVTSWPVAGKSLAEIIGWGKVVREKKPGLVIVAIPAGNLSGDEDLFIGQYNSVVNSALTFHYQEWDCITVLPSVTRPDLSGKERGEERLAFEVIKGRDLELVEREKNDKSSAEELFASWLKEKLGK